MAELVLVVLLLAALGGAWWMLRDLRAVPAGQVPADGPVGGVDGPVGGAVSLSVVIPARDEERTLPSLLHSLGALAGGMPETVVVDDGSRDATGSVARSAGVEVVAPGEPPFGWTGKAWACHRGACSTDGDLLLFLDADTDLAPDALDGLHALHHRHGGLVSVQPFHRVVRPYEQLSAYFNVVSVLASAAFTRRPPSHPMAFGPCLLTSRADYETAGGHAAVRGAVLDDVELAAAYRRAGLPVTCAIGGRAIRMRSYPGGLRQLADGWTKNFASGAAATRPGPALATVLWVSAHHAVAVGAGAALVATLTGLQAPLSSGHPALWAVAWVAVASQLAWTLSRIGSFRWWAWALFPLPLIAFDLIFARSVALTAVRRSVRWRGRRVDLRRRGSVGGA